MLLYTRTEHLSGQNMLANTCTKSMHSLHSYCKHSDSHRQTHTHTQTHKSHTHTHTHTHTHKGMNGHINNTLTTATSQTNMNSVGPMKNNKHSMVGRSHTQDAGDVTDPHTHTHTHTTHIHTQSPIPKQINSTIWRDG